MTGKRSRSKSSASIPRAVAEFVDLVARVKNVKCVAVEDGDDKVIELTTFAEPLTEETRDAVYAVEETIIDSFPKSLFDFHLRNAGELRGVKMSEIPGIVAVWGSVDENSRRAPETGRR